MNLQDVYVLFYMREDKQQNGIIQNPSLKSEEQKVDYLNIFSSPVGMYRKSCCTIPSVGIGVGVRGGDFSKMLKVFLHLSFLCEEQGADLILYLHVFKLLV